MFNGKHMALAQPPSAANRPADSLWDSVGTWNIMVVSSLFLLKHLVGDRLCPGVVPTCDNTDISTQNMMGSHFDHNRQYTISKFSFNKAYTFRETDVRVARNFDCTSIGYLEFCDLGRTNRTSVYKLYAT
jgi:hypothetical protein